MEKELNETFVVVYGDIVHRINLKNIIAIAKQASSKNIIFNVFTGFFKLFVKTFFSNHHQTFLHTFRLYFSKQKDSI